VQGYDVRRYVLNGRMQILDSDHSMWLSGHLDVELEQLQRLVDRVDNMMLGDGCHVVAHFGPGQKKF